MIRPRVPPAVAVGIAAALLHAVTLGAGFAWDDFTHVPAALAHPFSFAELFQPGIRFRPLLYLPGGIDAALFGARALAWHATNLLLHGTAVGLAFAVLQALLPGKTRLAIVAFAVHPAASEVAAWIMARGDSLSSSFGLGAVLAAIVASRSTDASRAARAAAMAGALALGAMLSKETGVVWIPIAAACAWSAVPEPRAARVKSVLLALLLAALAWTLLRRFAVEGGTGTLRGLAQPGAARTVLATAGWYVRALLAPLGYQPYVEDPPRDGLNAAIGMAAVAAGLAGFAIDVRSARERPPLIALGLFWIGVAIAPAVLTAPSQVSTSAVADRHLYAALPGLALLLGGIAARVTLPMRDLAVVGGALALGAGVMSVRRDRVWHDDQTLWSAVLEYAPSSRYAMANLGMEELGRGRLDEAERIFRRARESSEADSFMLVEAASADAMLLAGQGRFADASAALEQVADLPTDSSGAGERARAQAVLAIARMNESDGAWIDGQAAAQQLEVAVRARRDPIAAWHLAAALERAGERVDAVEAYTAVERFGRVILAPGLAARSDARGLELIEAVKSERDPAKREWDAARIAERGGSAPLAAAHYAEVVRLSPDRRGAWLRAAETAERAGKRADAARFAIEASRRVPERTGIALQAALFVAASGDDAGAITRLEALQKSGVTSASGRIALAEAYQHTHRADDAKAQYRAALEDPLTPPALKRELEARLAALATP